MGRPASHGVPRAPCYSGEHILTGTFVFRIRDFHPLWSDFPDSSARIGFVTPQCFRNPRTNPGLGCSDFARRYLRNKCLSLFLQVLRCFSSLRSPCTPMNSVHSDWELPQPRFRIQKSPDRRLFASFPEHIAGYHVFHRLSMPRHPPYTLSNLITFIAHPRPGQDDSHTMPSRAVP